MRGELARRIRDLEAERLRPVPPPPGRNFRNPQELERDLNELIAALAFMTKRPRRQSA